MSKANQFIETFMKAYDKEKSEIETYNKIHSEQTEKLYERFDSIRFDVADEKALSIKDRQTIKTMVERIEVLEDVIIQYKKREELYRQRYELTCSRLNDIEHYLPSTLDAVFTAAGTKQLTTDLTNKINEYQATARKL